MEPFITLGMSLGVGLLIGLQRQRQRVDNPLGGIRTFPLMSLFGTFCGWIGATHGEWVIGAGVVALFGVLTISNFLSLERTQPHSEPGQTTEVAALLTFMIGAYLVSGDKAVASVAAGIVVVLLHLKQPMHVFVERMGQKDMLGIMQFVVITLIILPLLPDKTFGPFDVLNPFDIWRMVVLIVGISLAGYIALKVVGEQAGTLLGGIFGGLVSSTATTVSYARRTKGRVSHLAAVAILIASAIAFVRVLIEVAVVSPGYFPRMGPPIGAVLVWMALICAAAFWYGRGESDSIPEPGNPAELKSALIFGCIYAVVLFAVAMAKQQFGSSGLYVVSVISGLTDMDAITLSVSRMVQEGRIEPSNGWRLILVASVANLAFKGIMAGIIAGWRFGLRLGMFLGIGAVGAAAVFWLWPDRA